MPIRPLSLPPSQSPTLTPVAPQPRPSGAGPTLGLAAAPSGANPGPGALAAAPAAPLLVPATDDSASSNNAAPIIPAGASFNPPTPATNDTATRIAVAQSVAASVKHLAADQSSHAMSGYVATAGSTRAATYQSSGGTNSTSLTGSGTSDHELDGGSATSPASSAGGATSAPGNWTIAPPPPSGGGQPQQPFTGQIGFHALGASGGGDPLIGSPGSASLIILGDNSNNARITNVQWTVSGKLYSGQQTVPNPTQLSDPPATAGKPSTPSGATTFTTPVYQIPQPDDNANTGLSFCWSETPGDVTITATAKITIGSNSANATAKETIHVEQPPLSGRVIYLDQASIGGGYLQYAAPKGGTLLDGTRTTSRLEGVDWNELSVGGQGTLKVEQLVLSGSSVAYTSTANAANTKTGLVYQDPNTLAATAPKLPLIDLDAGATEPWYEMNQNLKHDSPEWPLLRGYSTRMNLNFRDYVMFKPANGGVWVPEGTFSWTIDATFDPTASPVVKTTATATKATVNHSAWPTDWNDISYKYLSVV